MTSYYGAARSNDSAATTLHPDGESAQLGNQPLSFAFLPLLHGCMTENLIRVGNVGHDVTVFSGSLLLPAYKAEKKVVFSKEFTLESFIKRLWVLGAPTRRCHVKNKHKSRNCSKSVAFDVRASAV